MDYMFIRYHQVKLVYMVRFYMIKIKGCQNSKISSLFRSSWNTDNGPGKRGRGFPKINT